MKRSAATLLLLSCLCIPAVSALAQTRSEAQRISDLEQDVLSLKESIGQMRMDMEQLQRENAALKGKLGDSNKKNAASLVTVNQLNAQLANLRAELTRAQSQQKDEIIDEVSRQIERLAQQTQQALQTQAAAARPEPAEQTITFSDNYPKNGISYTVSKGDTLSGIAKRFNSSVVDIQNANRIADPRKIQLGQTLFIPQKPE